MDYITNYYKNLCESLQEKVTLLEERIKKKPQHLPFEILDIDAPFEFGKTHWDPSDINISGRHVRPDGSRGPEVHIPIYAFADIHYHDVADHVEDFMKGRKSPGNPLFDAWYDQGGDSPTTMLVDSSKVKPVRRS
jgi:hypothetical protein